MVLILFAFSHLSSPAVLTVVQPYHPTEAAAARASQELRQFLPHVYLKRPSRNHKNVEQVTSAWSDPLLLAFRQSSPSPYPLLAARNDELAP
jgi:uncharacterized protein YcsI (UPF0317 family)